MWLRNPASIMLALALLTLPGCTGSGFQKEALEGVPSPRIAFTLWERTMPAVDGGSTIEIVGVRRADGWSDGRSLTFRTGSATLACLCRCVAMCRSSSFWQMSPDRPC